MGIRTLLLPATLALGCTGAIGEPVPWGVGPTTGGSVAGAIYVTSGLRRLTAEEYDSTLAVLLRDESRPATLLLPEDKRTPFDNDYSLQEPSQALVEGAEALATDASARLLADPARRDLIVGCTPAAVDDEACLRGFVTSLGRRAFRRPLSPDEVSTYMVALDLAREEGDFYAAVDVVLRAILQDPHFLYRIEIGTPVPGKPGLRALDGFERATRLSYFLWGSMPDDALLDRAESGGLDDSAGVREAVEAMLADPRARAQLDRFHALWLNYERLPFDAELVVGMRTETRALIERVVFDEQRPWHDLFRMDETFVNDALAEHYGLTPPGSATPVWVPYAGSGRQGILSQGAFLSNGAKFGDTSPVQRGRTVRTRLLCQTILPPPPEVNPDIPPEALDPQTGASLCKPARMRQHEKGGCVSCHGQMDPVGFGLENFDQQGRFRDHEPDRPDCPIDGHGALALTDPDRSIDFVGPAGLSDAILEDDALDRCVTEQLYRFAMGRADFEDEDDRAVEALAAHLQGRDFTLEDALIVVATSDAFLYRQESP